MPAIDFPASPSVNDEYSFEGRTWLWNGTGWEVKSYPAALQLGSASAPSLYFTGDPNTGLYSPGADQVAISTGGTGRLFVDASGNVGIGAASSGERLFVSTASSGVQIGVSDGTTSQRVGYCGFGNAFSGSATNHPYILVTNDTERLRITSDGKVGIGTSAPQEKLHISSTTSSVTWGSPGNPNQLVASTMIGDIGTAGGSFAVRTNTVSSTYASGFGVDGTFTNPTATINIKAFGVQAVGYSSDLAFHTTKDTSLIERVRIDTSGRLLVGTSTSTSLAGLAGLAQVESATAATAGLSAWCDNETAGFGSYLALGRSRGSTVGSNTAVQNNDDLGRIYFFGANGADRSNWAAEILCSVDGTPFSGGDTTDLPGRLVFSTTADGAASPTERMRITSDGKVGIGTSSPSTLLHLSQTGSTQAGLIETDQSASVLNFKSTGQSSGQPQVGCSGSNLILNTDGAERLRITSDGKVGIGTSSPSQLLDITGNADATIGQRILNNSTGGSAQAFIKVSAAGRDVNYVVNYTGQYLVESGSSITAKYSDFDTHIWRNNAASERARIDSSGRLLVGTSTSTSTYGVSSAVQVFGTTYDTSSISLLRQTDTANDSAGIFIARQRASGTKVLSSGDRIGYISFVGHNGGDLNAGAVAEIHAYADGEFTTAGDTTDTPGRLSFWTTANGAATPTEAMRINNQRELLIGTTTRTANGGVLQVSNGITFPATQSACSDANTLDDYEEGTFDPTYNQPGGLTISYTSRTGRYIKIGKTVWVYFHIDVASISGTNSSNIIVGGFPFACVNATNANSGAFIHYASGWTTNQPSSFRFDVNASTGTFFFRTAADGGYTNTPANAIAANCVAQFNLCYETN